MVACRSLRNLAGSSRVKSLDGSESIRVCSGALRGTSYRDMKRHSSTTGLLLPISTFYGSLHLAVLGDADVEFTICVVYHVSDEDSPGSALRSSYKAELAEASDFPHNIPWRSAPVNCRIHVGYTHGGTTTLHMAEHRHYYALDASKGR